MGLKSWFRQVGGVLQQARPFLDMLIPGIGTAIDRVERVALHLKELGPAHVLTGEHKEDLAVWELADIVDGLTGDHVTADQWAAIRAHIRTGVAVKNAFSADPGPAA